VRDGFAVGGLGRSAGPGAAQVGNCAPWRASPFQVVRQNLGLGVADRRERRFDGIGDLRVEFDPVRPQHRFVRDVADQGMFESVRLLPWQADKDAGIGKLPQTGCRPLFGHVGGLRKELN
jgi:hypothetical protein